MINIEEKSPRKIASSDNCTSIDNPIRLRMMHMISDSVIVIFPAVIGLFFVLSTCLSILLSNISFIMHPALRIMKLPKANKHNNQKLSYKLLYNPVPIAHGMNNKIDPVGAQKRIRFIISKNLFDRKDVLMYIVLL